MAGSIGVRVAINRLAPSHVMECAVDWMTATIRNGSEQRALAILCEEWLLDRSCEGYEVKGWRWNNYSGSVTDGISFGRREDGFIVRLSGSMAVRHWLTTATWAHNVSRFDVQATVLAGDPRDEFAYSGFTKLALDPRVESGATTTRYIENTPAGSSLYVGSRSSDRMLRLYDKTAESDGDYPNRSWRYEIEYKSDRAQRVVERIKADRHPTQAIFDTIQTAYSDYGIGMVADRPGWEWRPTVTRHETTDERRLAWLARCIRPCVTRLTEAVGVDRVMVALGLQMEVDELTGEVEYTTTRDLATTYT